MKQSKYVLSTALATAIVVGMASFHSANAQQEYKPKAEVTALHEGTLTGDESKTVIVKHFTLPAGFVGGKHFHPGDVFVYVLEGALTVATEKGVRTVAAGELYPEVPGMEMVGKNLSTSVPTKLVVFQVGDTGKPMMIKAE